MEKQWESNCEMDRWKLERINILLDSQPDNADLWLEKAIYTNNSLVRSKNDPKEEIAEIAIRYALKSGQYGMEGLNYTYVLSFLYFGCHDYKKVISLVEPMISSEQLFSAIQKESEKHVAYEMFSMLVHSYADMGETRKVDTLLQIMEATGITFSEEYVNVVLRQDLCWIKQLFFNDALLQYEKLRSYIIRWSEESLLNSNYFERIAQVYIVMKEMTLFFNQDEIREKLIFYQREYGNSFITKVFEHWIECGYQFRAGDLVRQVEFENIESAASLLNKTFVYGDLKALSGPGTYFDILKINGHEAWFEKRQMLRDLYLYLRLHDVETYHFAYPCMGDIYMNIKNGDLDIYFYQKICRIVLKWDYPELITLKVMFFRRFSYILVNHGRLGQALRCVEFASRFLPEVEDKKLLERFYEIWSGIYDRMGLKDKAIEIWRNSKMSEECKESNIKWIVDKPEFFSLASFTDGSIPRRKFTLKYDDYNMHISYSSLHGLYHTLYLLWRGMMNIRENFEHRAEGVRLWERECALHRALIKTAVLTECYDFALEHIEEYSCFELQSRILFFKNIYRSSSQEERSKIKGIDRAYRQLADAPWGSAFGIFMDAKILRRELEQTGHKAFRENPGYAEQWPDLSDKSKIKQLLLEFYYGKTGTFCFILDGRFHSILDTLIFSDTGEKNIEEWSEAICDLDIYNFFRTKPDGSLEISAARIHVFEEVLKKMDARFYPLMKKVLSKYDPEMLVIIPYRAMYHLPLQLLGYSEGHPLSEQYTISFAPSHTVYRELQDRDSKEIQSAVFFADSLGYDERYRLPFAQHETEQIESILKEQGIATRGYTQTAASYTHARQAFEGADILHIGCHTFFDAKNPGQSGILLYDSEEKAEGQERHKALTLQTLWDEIDLQSCRLINLSSCYSASSENGGYGVNEFWGIPNGCLYAGADCVLANAGKVNDMVSYIFNMRFYTCFKEMGASRALSASIQELCALSMSELHEEVERLPEESRRLAKLQLGAIEKCFGSEYSLAHPIFWSGFRMIGKW